MKQNLLKAPMLIPSQPWPPQKFFADSQHNVTLKKSLHQNKIIFFLHLLGIDSNGHAHKPFSRLEHSFPHKHTQTRTHKHTHTSTHTNKHTHKHTHTSTHTQAHTQAHTPQSVYLSILAIAALLLITLYVHYLSNHLYMICPAFSYLFS